MTNAELKEALLNKKPVVVTTNDGAILHCRCVSGIVYREKNGRVIVSGEGWTGTGIAFTTATPRTSDMKARDEHGRSEMDKDYHGYFR